MKTGVGRGDSILNLRRSLFYLGRILLAQENARGDVERDSEIGQLTFMPTCRWDGFAMSREQILCSQPWNTYLHMQG